MAGKFDTGRSFVLALALAMAGAVAPFAGLRAEPAVDTGTIRVAVATPETEPGAEVFSSPKAKATARVQRCYAQLGYYKGPIDGKVNKAVWTAHWHFKNEHGLKAYGDFLAEPVQKKIDELCKKEPEPAPEEVVEEVGEDPPGPVEEEQLSVETEQAPDMRTALMSEADPAPVESQPIPALSRLAIDCLPADLIAVLRQAHGPEGVIAKACHQGCLPSPAGLGQAQLDELQSDHGVAWCRSCIEIDAHLALDDIARIEAEGNIELCATPPRHLPRPGVGNGNVVKSFSRVRELYRALPPAPEDPSTIAVVIGNAAYDNLPAAETARNDAGAIYFFLTEHFGVRRDQIIDLRNARRSDFERVFGPVPGSDGELARLVRGQPGAKIVVYYSGHGATNASHSEAYLLPVNAEPYREERSGFPLSTVYTNLAALDADSVLVLLESSFGRDHGSYILPPNLPETTKSALPAEPLSNVTVMAAADRGQRSLVDTRYDVGLFTRYLIEGLSGRADLYPVGNGDGLIDSAEIYAYAAAMSRLAARKTFGLLQEPVYSSAATPVLSGSGQVAAKPN